MPNLDQLIKEAAEQGRDQYAEKLLKIGTNLFYIIIAFAVIAVGVYVKNFGTAMSTVKADWGVFGDFLGGLLNPAVGLVTVYLVLVNARLQRQELKNSIEEMKNSNLALEKQNAAIEIQNFQNTFFNWLSAYREIISEVSFKHPSSVVAPLTSYAAIGSIFNYCMDGPEIERAFGASNFSPIAYNRILKEGEISENEDLEAEAERIILNHWKICRISFDHPLSGILRSLIGLINWIEERPESIIPQKKKWEYFRIIKSHLSNAEKCLLFYESWKLKNSTIKTICKYDLLDDLPLETQPYLRFMSKRAKHLQKGQKN